MAWLRNLFGNADKEPTPSAEFPVRLVIDPELTITVYSHPFSTQAGEIQCWTYATEGLVRYQQAEVIFTLKREPKESPAQFPHDPIQVLQLIAQLAQEGRCVGVFDFTEFASKKFFGNHLLYIAAEALPSVPVPNGAIAAVLITDGEMQMLKAFGPLRLAARLGKERRHYPCPPWSERNRAGLDTESVFQKSHLKQMPCVFAGDISVTQIGQNILLRAKPSAQQWLAQTLEQLPLPAALAFLTGLDEQADGCLVWEPGQNAPCAITPPTGRGARLGACFVTFIPEQADEKGAIVEDGVGLLLSNEHWQQLRNGFIQSTDVEFALNPDQTLRLEWLKPGPTLRDPFSGDTYGGKLYTPQGGVREDIGPVQLKQIHLVTPEDVIALNTSAEAISQFIHAAKPVVIEHLGKAEASFRLMVRFTLHSSQAHEVNLATTISPPQALLGPLYEALQALPTLHTRKDDVVVMLEFTINAPPN